MLYLAMYISGYVHIRHSSFALRGHMRGTHPELEKDEFYSGQLSVQPLEGSAERTLSSVSLWRKQVVIRMYVCVVLL